ncbi:MAG: J domain-containing protein [Deltaproteobacteria bacterium]|nr:J domain-containing protein [Deltaproteobacteria bacterium]
MSIRKSYKTLELNYGASTEEVKQAYKDLVRVWHPDRFNEDLRLRKKAEEKLKEVNRAYGELMAFFSEKMAMTPTGELQSLPRWWNEGFGVIALAVTLTGRNTAQRVWTWLARMNLGRIIRAVLPYGSGDDPGYGKGRAPESPGESDAYTGRGHGPEERDFRSVFDEVSRERIRGFNRGKRPH